MKGECKARVGREYINSLFIHVTLQGLNKEYIFKNDEYKKQYLEYLLEISKDYEKLKILAYCIMDNHVHLLIYTEEIFQLSKLMSRVNTKYAGYYNKKLNRVGYVFKNRYYSKPIADKNHLYATIAYIHTNPTKAGIVNKEIEYKYSSYKNYKMQKIEKSYIKLLFNSTDYIKIFDFIHRKFQNYELNVNKELKIKNAEDTIEKFCKQKQKKIEEIKKNNNYLLELVEELRIYNNLKNVEINKLLNIGKNRITKIKNNKK